MRQQLFTASCVFAGVIAGVCSTPVHVAGQAPKAVATTKASIPRLADGHPDLQGTFDLATLTPVERQAGTPITLTDEQAAKLEKQVAATKNYQARPVDGDRPAPPVGGDGSAGPAGNVGGENRFWVDSGSHYSVIGGQERALHRPDPAGWAVTAPHHGG